MTGNPEASDNQSNQNLTQPDAQEGFDSEVVSFPGISPARAESILKRLGGGVAEKHQLVEGVGFRAVIAHTDDGVSVEFIAHEELLDDLIRRFEDMAAREV